MSEAVNHPKHYTSHPSGIEVIKIARWMPFNLGNAFKYVARAGLKDPGKTVEDLRKAVWYIRDELASGVCEYVQLSSSRHAGFCRTVDMFVEGEPEQWKCSVFKALSFVTVVAGTTLPLADAVKTLEGQIDAIERSSQQTANA